MADTKGHGGTAFHRLKSCNAGTPKVATPAGLAALQWRDLVSTCRQEGRELLGDRYLELRYEDFLNDSIGEIQRLQSAVQLSSGESNLQQLKRRNKNYDSEWSQVQKRKTG